MYLAGTWKCPRLPNTACSRQVELCAFYESFSGLRIILLPSRVRSHPLAANASHWAAFHVNRIETFLFIQ
jgi:hypothetical protein